MKDISTNTFLVVFLSCCLLLSGCSEQPSKKHTTEAPSPSNRYALTKEELDTVCKAANAGDVAAMNRLASYYNIYLGDDEQGYYWLERAGDAGDMDARSFLLGYYAERKSFSQRKYGEALRAKWTIQERGHRER